MMSNLLTWILSWGLDCTAKTTFDHNPHKAADILYYMFERVEIVIQAALLPLSFYNDH